MGKLTYEELVDRVELNKKVLGLTHSQAGGRVFEHIRDGGFYVAANVGFVVGDLEVQVEYHPLTQPVIRFHREINDFLAKFRPVQYQPD